MATPAGSQPHLGKKQLTTLHAIGQSLALGPIFSAALFIGLISASAGFHTPASIILGGIGMIALAYVIALYARRFAGAGSMYEYIARGVNPWIGILTAGIYFMGMLFLGAGGVYVGLGFLIKGFFQAHISSIDPPFFLCGLVALSIVIAANHFGARLAVRAVLALAVFSLIPLFILAIAVIAQGGDGGNTLSALSFSGAGWNGPIFKGILVAVTLFIGFEAAAAIAEETPNPHRSIPIAVIGTVAIATVFYVLMGYVVMIGFGQVAIDKGVAAADPNPLGTLAQHYVGSWLSTWVDLVVITDALSLSVAFTVAATRGVFALARDGLLPRFLATTSSHDTPLGGNIVSFVVSIGFLIWASTVHYGGAFGLPDTLAAFQILSLAGSYLIEFVYLLLALGAFLLVVRSEPRSKWWWQMPVLVVAAITTPLAYKGSLWPWPPPYPLNRGIYFAIGAAIIALVWALALQLLKPGAVRGAAAYATRIEDVAPAGAPVDLGL